MTNETEEYKLDINKWIDKFPLESIRAENRARWGSSQVHGEMIASPYDIAIVGKRPVEPVG